MKFILETIEKFNASFSSEKKPKVQRLEEDVLYIIKSLTESGVSPEDMAVVLDLSVNRVNYEIKQLESKELIQGRK